MDDLYSPDILVRDAAVLALEDSNDPLVIEALRQAMGREPSWELREYMQQVLDGKIDE